MMEGCRQPLLLLCLTAVAAMNTLGCNAQIVEEDKLQGKNVTDELLQVIPHSCNNSVTKLVIEGNRITLNETDRLALASYPKLEELHLDGNLVTRIPEKFFSVVPQLRVLSLARNKISSLDPESFSGLEVLTELDLSHNLLTSLHTQLLSGLSKLQVLKLQENPWNCSCPLLSSTAEAEAAGVTAGELQVTCASPEKQAGSDLLQALCDPTTPPTFTTVPQNTSQQPLGSSTTLKLTLTSSQKRINDEDQTPVLGNTWKFTAGVAAFALCTLMVIVGAIKGPSWYKLFHNYRHRRLRQEEEEEDAVSTVFSETGRYLNHQTFTFEQDNGQIEEEEEEDEDGYFEDPYIRRDTAEEISAEP